MRILIALIYTVVLAFRATGAMAEAPLFSEQRPPAQPDYNLASSWAAGPFGKGASAVLPKGASLAAEQPPADVFYVHPTTYRSNNQWNQDLADEETNAWTDASVIARQASAFNGCCRVFAPRYRQASFLNRDGGRDLALELAYTDIEKAFNWYLKHENNGRPFIVAGHSQGAWLIAELLEKRIDSSPLKDRMIAAYIVGINLSEGDFGKRFKHVHICGRPAQTGCAVQWNSVLPEADIAAMSKAYQSTYVKRFGDDAGKATICINPITFDRRKPVAERRLAKGAVPGAPGEGEPLPLMLQAVGAKCDRGMLVVRPDAALDLKSLPGGVMHYHDIGLFYQDVRANAVLRTNAWIKEHSAR